MRILWTAMALLLAGCFGADPVCDDSTIDTCATLAQWPASSASHTFGEPTTLTLDFRESGAQRPRTLRLVCETNGELEDCVKSWVMPDLDRLPHAEAQLLGLEEPVESMRGKFRIDDVLLLNDGESYRVTGSVDALRFEADEEILVFAEGEFDLVTQEVP